MTTRIACTRLGGMTRRMQLALALPTLAVALGLLPAPSPLAGAETIQCGQDGDCDHDGLSDDNEVNVYGTNMVGSDTDNDGLSDGEEVYLGTDPLVPNAAPERADADSDGLFDDDELYVYGTDPYGWDTDGDGVGDGEEVYVGTDPLAG
jgi:Bacterial TSP3 repeat